MRNNDSNVDVSFIIPTNRQHDKYLYHTLNRIREVDTLNYTYEILVSSCYDDNQDNVQFIKDVDNEGSIKPINYLASISKGKYICVLTDDYLPTNNLFYIFKFLESDTFKDRKYKITGFSVAYDNGYVLPSEPVPPTTINPYTKEECIHKGMPHILKFPVMTRETFELFGSFIFHPHFVHHVSDNYLSLYLDYMNEPPIECRHVHVIDWAGRNAATKYDAHDMCVLFHLMKNINYSYCDKKVFFKNAEESRNYYNNLK